MASDSSRDSEELKNAKEKILDCEACGKQHSRPVGRKCKNITHKSKNEALQHMVQEEKDKKKMLEEQRRQVQLETELEALRGETGVIERDITQTRTGRHQPTRQQIYNQSAAVPQRSPAPTVMQAVIMNPQSHNTASPAVLQPIILNPRPTQFYNRAPFKGQSCSLCPICQKGLVEPQFTWCGIVLAALCYPIGVLCCILLMRPTCGVCGYIMPSGSKHRSAAAPSTARTTRTAQFDNIEEPSRVVQIPGACPICQNTTIESRHTWYGILLAVVLFPCGILCCLILKKRICSSCGYSIG